jgi:hypothetical protein
MTARRSVRGPVLFRAAAGPRQGYGHLVRTTVLARALGVRPLVCVRGPAAATAAAARLGCRTIDGPARDVLIATCATLLVIDDPSAAQAAVWRRAAARLGVPVASVHDLGLAYVDADLTIDGSMVRPGPAPRGPSLLGPRFALVAERARRRRAPHSPSVLIALGGGPRARLAIAIARAIRRARPEARIRVAGGLSASTPVRLPAGVRWLGPRRGLAGALARAAVAVVGGGVSLYEACCLGTPAVGVSVVAAQRPTVAGLAAAGAAVDGGSARHVSRVAGAAVALLADARRRARLSRAGRRLVDGRGPARVASALVRLERSR